MPELADLLPTYWGSRVPDRWGDNPLAVGTGIGAEVGADASAGATCVLWHGAVTAGASAVSAEEEDGDIGLGCPAAARNGS